MPPKRLSSFAPLYEFEDGSVLLVLAKDAYVVETRHRRERLEQFWAIWLPLAIAMMMATIDAMGQRFPENQVTVCATAVPLCLFLLQVMLRRAIEGLLQVSVPKGKLWPGVITFSEHLSRIFSAYRSFAVALVMGVMIVTLYGAYDIALIPSFPNGRTWPHWLFTTELCFLYVRTLQAVHSLDEERWRKKRYRRNTQRRAKTDLTHAKNSALFFLSCR